MLKHSTLLVTLVTAFGFTLSGCMGDKDAASTPEISSASDFTTCFVENGFRVLLISKDDFLKKDHWDKRANPVIYDITSSDPEFYIYDTNSNMMKDIKKGEGILTKLTFRPEITGNDKARFIADAKNEKFIAFKQLTTLFAESINNTRDTCELSLTYSKFKHDGLNLNLITNDATAESCKTTHKNQAECGIVASGELENGFNECKKQFFNTNENGACTIKFHYTFGISGAGIEEDGYILHTSEAFVVMPGGAEHAMVSVDAFEGVVVGN